MGVACLASSMGTGVRASSSVEGGEAGERSEEEEGDGMGDGEGTGDGMGDGDTASGFMATVRAEAWAGRTTVAMVGAWMPDSHREENAMKPRARTVPATTTVRIVV